MGYSKEQIVELFKADAEFDTVDIDNCDIKLCELSNRFTLWHEENGVLQLYQAEFGEVLFLADVSLELDIKRPHILKMIHHFLPVQSILDLINENYL